MASVAILANLWHGPFPREEEGCEMTRVMRELNGKLGPCWAQSAKKE